MEKVKITIAGVPYSIMTDEGEEYTKALADEIDSKISGLMNRFYIAPPQATTLVLLECGDGLKKLQRENENLKAQLKEYLADAAQAKSERDMLKREVAKLKKSVKNGDTV